MERTVGLWYDGAMTTGTLRAERLLRERLRAIKQERAQLAGALNALEGSGSRSSSPKHRGATSQTGRTGSGPRAKAQGSQRAARGDRQRQLVAYLKSNPGARAKDVASALGISAANAHALLRRAREQKIVTKSDRAYALARRR